MVRAWRASRNGVCPEPCFLTAEDCDGTVVLWPMVLTKRSGPIRLVRTIHALGAGVFDYTDPLVVYGTFPMTDDRWTAVLNLVVDSMEDFADELVINSTRLDISDLILSSGNPQVAPFADLSRYKSMDSFMAARPAKHRSDVERCLRRAKEKGTLRLVNDDTATDEEVHSWIARIQECRSRRHPDARDLAPFLLELFREKRASGGPAWFSALYLNDHGIAWHAGFRTRRTAYWFAPGFDETWKSVAPGKLHVHHCISDALASGCGTFDFLRGTERYKENWTDGGTQTTRTLRHLSGSMSSAARRFLHRCAKSMIARPAPS